MQKNKKSGRGPTLFHTTLCAAAVFPTCSQQHVVYILAVASLCTWSAAAAAVYQIYSTKTKYINIVMYITMPFPTRVVMTELKLTYHLGVCDIEKKKDISIFCRVCYCADIWLPWTAAVFDILHILCGQFTSVIEIIFFICLNWFLPFMGNCTCNKAIFFLKVCIFWVKLLNF